MGAETEFTIDELARAADTTVRSVRVYHERGLLPSPEVRGRIGYYGADHLNRLQTISRLLGRGMKLNGIRELLAAWDRGDGLADVLGVAQNAESTPPTVSSETSESPPTSDTGDDSETPLPDYLAEALATSEDPLDLYRVTNPRCCDLATRLRDAGLPLERTFHIIEGMRAESDRLADHYAADLFYALAGHQDDGSPGTSKDRTALETELAIARLIVTRATTELIDQAFEKHAQLPLRPPSKSSDEIPNQSPN